MDQAIATDNGATRRQATNLTNRVTERRHGRTLFVRHARGARLNRRGHEYLDAVQSRPQNAREATERHLCRGEENQPRLVAVEGVARKWLVPRLADFGAKHPETANRARYRSAGGRQRTKTTRTGHRTKDVRDPANPEARPEGRARNLREPGAARVSSLGTLYPRRSPR